MKKLDLFDRFELKNQAEIQQKKAWDLERDIHWGNSIQENSFFVPFEEKLFGFEGVSDEQRIVLSQFFGLIINQTISEMESSLPKLKLAAWERKLDAFPVNSEMINLGEIFFEEEKKHAQSFKRFQDLFCEKNSVESDELELLLPRSLNSYFLKSIIWNAEKGGSSFWWLVASVEEVSISIFRKINQERKNIDPLFFELHKKHAEEEVRHESYAYLMLELDYNTKSSYSKLMTSHFDMLLSQVVSVPWMVTELSKIFRVKTMENKSEFFKVLSSCLPFLEEKNFLQHLRNILTQTPYISWFANPKFRQNQNLFLKDLKNSKLDAA